MTSPTPTRGVPVQLDRERRLRYSLRAMRLIREEFGEAAVAAGIPADMLGKFLWHGLVHEDPSLTVEQVEELVDGENLEEMSNAILKAFGQATVPPLTATAAVPLPAVAAASNLGTKT